MTHLQRRLAAIAAGVLFVLILAPAALAQTSEAEPGPGAAAVLLTLSGFGVILSKVVDAIRRQPWAANLSGTGVQAVALFLAIAAVWALDLRGTEALLQSIGAGYVGRLPAPVLDYVISGAYVAAIAGVFADQKPKEPAIVEVDAEGKPL